MIKETRKQRTKDIMTPIWRLGWECAPDLDEFRDSWRELFILLYYDNYKYISKDAI